MDKTLEDVNKLDDKVFNKIEALLGKIIQPYEANWNESNLAFDRIGIIVNYTTSKLKKNSWLSAGMKTSNVGFKRKM